MPTIKLDLGPWRETEFGFQGCHVLSWDPKDGSCNLVSYVHKSTVIYFCWHLTLNLKAFKESHTAVAAYHSRIRLWASQLLESQSHHVLISVVYTAGQGAMQGREAGVWVSTVHDIWGVLPLPMSPRGQHYYSEEQWGNTCGLLLIQGSSKDQHSSKGIIFFLKLHDFKCFRDCILNSTASGHYPYRLCACLPHLHLGSIEKDCIKQLLKQVTSTSKPVFSVNVGLLWWLIAMRQSVQCQSLKKTWISPLLKRFVLIWCVWMFGLRVCLCTMCMQRPEEKRQSLWNWAFKVVMSYLWCWEPNPGPLQEQCW